MFRSWRQNFLLTFLTAMKTLKFNNVELTSTDTLWIILFLVELIAWFLFLDRFRMLAQFFSLSLLSRNYRFFLLHLSFQYLDLMLRFSTRLSMKLQSFSLVFTSKTFSKLNFNFSQFFISQRKFFASHSWKNGKEMLIMACDSENLSQGFIFLVLEKFVTKIGKFHHFYRELWIYLRTFLVIFEKFGSFIFFWFH